MPVEREIARGQVPHLYEVFATGDLYLRVEVEQEKIDLVVLVTEGGTPVTEVNNPGEWKVPERISFLPDADVFYRLEVRPAPEATARGRYRIRIAEEREPVAADRIRIAAERAEAAADQLYQKPTAEGLVQALSGYRSALAGWEELGELRKQAEMLNVIGVIHRMRGEHREALESLDLALEVARRQGDRDMQAMALNQKGLACAGLAQYAEALAAFEEALAVRRVLGDEAEQGPILNNIGLVHRSTGRMREASAAFREALEIFHRAEDRRRESRAFGNLAGAYTALGEPSAALESLEQALAMARSVGDRAGEAEWLNHIGLVKRRLGDVQAALESHSAALALFRDLGDRPRQAVVLNNLGALQLDLGEPEAAIGYFERALQIQRETGARTGEAVTLNNLARADSLLDRPAGALARFQQALAIEREVGDRFNEALTLTNLGLHHAARGEPREALEPLGRALELWRELGDRAGEGRALHNLGLARAALGDTGAALAAFAEALRLRRALGDPAGELAALQEMARAELGRGRLEAARSHLDPALELAESLRLRTTSDRLRSAQFASLHDTYELYIDLLMSSHALQPDAGLDARAFEMAERARARSLLDLLREARVEIGRGAEARLLEEERRLRIELNGKADRLTRLVEGKHTEEQAAEARQELEQAVTAYELAEARLRAALPAYAALVRPEPVTLAAVQALLEPETVLLEYALGAKRSFLWKVTPSSITSFELPARKEIEEAAKEAHAALSTPDPRQAVKRREALARLGRMLLGPVVQEARGKRLAIVAGGALQYLPFAALPLPSGEPAVARYEVVSLPSAAVLAELRRRGADQPQDRRLLAVVADPVFGADDPRVGKTGPASPIKGETEPADAGSERALRDTGDGGFARLAWTRREAEAAAAQAGGQPVLLALDFQASLETATGPDLSRARVVHFATHGILDDRYPELSGLVLSLVEENGRPRPGFLRLPEIYNLDLRADLVVLSGCQTALGKEVRGEGLMGLTRGFFYAGASQVVASLWPVRDRATAELMERFYRALFREGMSPAAALRAAQLSMRQDPRWRDPYFWAAFVVQGDWARRMLGSDDLFQDVFSRGNHGSSGRHRQDWDHHARGAAIFRGPASLSP